jgi:hypothetical protein
MQGYQLKAGDLVWHIDDINDGKGIPGLVMRMSDNGAEVVIRFNDRMFDEYHDVDDITERGP